MYPYLITGNAVVVVINNKQYTLSKGNIGFDALVEAIKEGRWEDVPALASPVVAVRKFSNGFVDVIDGQVTYDGQPIHSVLSQKILDMFEQGFDINPLTNFMQNLYTNPSKRAVDELYGFLESGNMPITEDGYFLAYKKVREDYTDVHSGKFDNSVGKVVSMPRNQVDDNKDNTCSAGLHFCSFDYLKSFGGSRIMILKINPADVVSIPSDYVVTTKYGTGGTKGRCWRYEVIGEVPVEEHTDNILVKTAVDTRWSRFDGSLERVFDKLTQSEKRTIANHYGLSHTFDILENLLSNHTYTEIRTTLRRLFN
jgi:hypothetical protein